jgi:hypothetical protein
MLKTGWAKIKCRVELFICGIYEAENLAGFLAKAEV